MKIQKINIEKEYSLISIEEHLDLLRSKFGIVYAANGVEEPQALAEAVTMSSQEIMTDDTIDEGIKLARLFMLYRQAANYAELLGHQKIR